MACFLRHVFGMLGCECSVQFYYLTLFIFSAECVDGDGQIILSHYIVGYEELYKFLNLLGTVFGWVSTDVDAKLEILRDHRKSDSKDNYQDVRTMLKYEVLLPQFMFSHLLQLTRFYLY